MIASVKNNVFKMLWKEMQRFITLDSAVGISSCDLCSDQNTQIIDGLLGHSQNCEKLKVLNNYLRYLGFSLQENGNSRV